jgi:hypothetical protein
MRPRYLKSATRWGNQRGASILPLPNDILHRNFIKVFLYFTKLPLFIAKGKKFESGIYRFSHQSRDFSAQTRSLNICTGWIALY